MKSMSDLFNQSYYRYLSDFSCTPNHSVAKDIFKSDHKIIAIKIYFWNYIPLTKLVRYVKYILKPFLSRKNQRIGFVKKKKSSPLGSRTPSIEAFYFEAQCLNHSATTAWY